MLTATASSLEARSPISGSFRPRVVASIAGLPSSIPQWHWLFCSRPPAMTLARRPRGFTGRVVAWYLASHGCHWVSWYRPPVRQPWRTISAASGWHARSSCRPSGWRVALWRAVLAHARRCASNHDDRVRHRAVAVWTLNLLLPAVQGRWNSASSPRRRSASSSARSRRSLCIAIVRCARRVIAGMLAVARRRGGHARLRYAVPMACGVVIAACAVRSGLQATGLSGIRSLGLARTGVVLAATWSAVAMRLLPPTATLLDTFDTWTCRFLAARRAVSAAIRPTRCSHALCCLRCGPSKVDWASSSEPSAWSSPGW